jgi:hypothetical protein
MDVYTRAPSRWTLVAPLSHARELWQFFELYTTTGATICCKLFSTDVGLELRLQSWSLAPERVQPVGSYVDARQLANQWLREITDRGNVPFSERTRPGWRTSD